MNPTYEEDTEVLKNRKRRSVQVHAWQLFYEETCESSSRQCKGHVLLYQFSFLDLSTFLTQKENEATSELWWVAIGEQNYLSQACNMIMTTNQNQNFKRLFKGFQRVVNNTEFFFRFEFGAVRCYVCKIFLKVSNLKKLEIENSEIKITENQLTQDRYQMNTIMYPNLLMTFLAN